MVGFGCFVGRVSFCSVSSERERSERERARGRAAAARGLPPSSKRNKLLTWHAMAPLAVSSTFCRRRPSAPLSQPSSSPRLTKKESAATDAILLFQISTELRVATSERQKRVCGVSSDRDARVMMMSGVVGLLPCWCDFLEEKRGEEKKERGGRRARRCRSAPPRKRQLGNGRGGGDKREHTCFVLHAREIATRKTGGRSARSQRHERKKPHLVTSSAARSSSHRAFERRRKTKRTGAGTKQ